MDACTAPVVILNKRGFEAASYLPTSSETLLLKGICREKTALWEAKKVESVYGFKGSRFR
jgi:hypothetical protein